MTTQTLLSTVDVAERVGLHPHTIQRWQLDGAITSSLPPAGSGHRSGWSHHDVMMLEQIANVRRDLTQLGLPCPHTLVARLWDDLTGWGEAHLYTTTVTISIRLGSETT